MAYKVEPFEVADEADWPAELQTKLDEVDADGWDVMAIMTRDKLIAPAVGGMGGVATMVPYTVLVLFKRDA